MSYKEINIFAPMDDERRENYKLEQTAYIVYMMVGSYFRSCEPHNHFLEKKYRLLYREMREMPQIGLEARVEREFLEHCPFELTVLADLKANARISRGENSASVWFRTGFEEVFASIDSDGKRSWQFRSGDRNVS